MLDASYDKRFSTFPSLFRVHILIADANHCVPLDGTLQAPARCGCVYVLLVHTRVGMYLSCLFWRYRVGRRSLNLSLHALHPLPSYPQYVPIYTKWLVASHPKGAGGTPRAGHLPPWLAGIVACYSVLYINY